MKIDVDFEVFKALTARRQSEQHTENSVLREVLGLLPVASTALTTMNGNDSEGEGWTSGDLTLPNGTELRGIHKGKYYAAKIVNGQFIYDGAPSSPSGSRYAITRTGGNGWWFWMVKKADSEEFESLGDLRDRNKQAPSNSL